MGEVAQPEVHNDHHNSLIAPDIMAAMSVGRRSQVKSSNDAIGL